MADIKIKKVIIDMGKFELELSLEEAKELKKELDKLLGFTYYPVTYLYPSSDTYRVTFTGTNTTALPNT